MDPRAFLPLTPIVLHVLLALADEPRHGYGIIQEVDARTDGLLRLRTGTLYVLLQRLATDKLVEHVRVSRLDVDVPAKTPGSPRRYYALTPRGRGVLAAETRRLAGVVSDARAKRVLTGSKA